jgi:Zn ribbon nucleic-acid-binding protein
MKVDQVVQLPEEPIMCILDGVDQRDIPIEECTFCGHISVDADINIKHMEDKHSFYVPRYF